MHNTNSVHQINKFPTKSNQRWWVRPVNLTRDEQHFFKATRMSVANFNLLLTLLKEKIKQFSSRKVRPHKFFILNYHKIFFNFKI